MKINIAKIAKILVQLAAVAPELVNLVKPIIRSIKGRPKGLR